MKKGIEPLIAAVLLIAFTIAIAALLVGFYNSFTREQISETSEKGDEVVSCGNANIKIFDVTVNSSLIVNVENTGSRDFNKLSLAVRNSSISAYTNIETNDTLKSGNVKSIVVDWSGSVYEVIVNTDCPAINSRVRNESGKFKEVF